MSVSISSPKLTERVQTSRPTEAPFVRCILKIRELEEKINAEVDLYVDLKSEIRGIIEKVENTDEQMVLRYRYIHNMTWEQIGDELHADKSTVRRWHGAALQHVVIPENPIII